MVTPEEGSDRGATRFDYVKTRREDVPSIGQEDPAKFRKGMKFYSRLNVWVYRLSFGLLMNTAMGGYPICLVTYTGHKSGKPRSIPLIHVPQGDDELLVGSQGGLDRDPVWVRSVQAHPDVVVTANGRRRKMRARQLNADEKRDVWPHLCSIYPPYDEYQARTDRDIPVFRCEPV
jgi:deazaflavin-dependent oxidoreductase (nitroreductase family)